MLGRILSFVLATLGVLLTCGGVPLAFESAVYGICFLAAGIVFMTAGAAIGASVDEYGNNGIS